MSCTSYKLDFQKKHLHLDRDSNFGSLYLNSIITQGFVNVIATFFEGKNFL